MPVYSFEGKVPDIHPDAFVAATATVVGDVTIEAGASIWYGAVVRADFGYVTIREGANVQDGSILHSSDQAPTVIGRNVTIGHACVVHGADIGDGALVANGSTVLDGATVGAGALVAAGSLILPGATIGEGMMAAGAPGSEKRPVAGTAAEEWVVGTSPVYAELAQRHKAGVEEVDSQSAGS